VSKIDGKSILSALEGNRFSKGQVEIFGWENSKLALPNGTKIILEHIPSSSQTGPDKHLVILEKPYFFRIEIGIQPMGASSFSVFPAGVSVQDQNRSTSRVYVFGVSLNAKFEKITSGNSRTENHKEWVSWLFSEIKNRIAD
jgi:hypothetical protein